MSEDPDSIVTDDRYPGWRARLVYDEYAGEPDGDALAPALVIVTTRQPYLAKGVFMPQSAEEILAAWQQLEDRALFERYLRMFHGATTAVEHVAARLPLTDSVVRADRGMSAHAAQLDRSGLVG
jgi:hypothetical protein